MRVCRKRAAAAAGGPTAETKSGSERNTTVTFVAETPSMPATRCLGPLVATVVALLVSACGSAGTNPNATRTTACVPVARNGEAARAREGGASSPDLTYLTDVKIEGGRCVDRVEFEAVVTWVIGISEQRPFTATVSDSQLVVEIQ